MLCLSQTPLSDSIHQIYSAFQHRQNHNQTGVFQRINHLLLHCSVKLNSQCAFDISWSFFSYNSRKTPYRLSVSEAWGVVRECKSGRSFIIVIVVVCTIVSQITAINRECTVMVCYCKIPNAHVYELHFTYIYIYIQSQIKKAFHCHTKRIHNSYRECKTITIRDYET